MTAPYLQGTGVVPEANALYMRGIQTDQYGEILGGHKALFDPIQSGMSGKLAVGNIVPNIVTDGPTAVCQATFNFAGNQTIEAAKGFNFSNVANTFERITLPTVFDLRNLGSEPSVIIPTWLTITSVPSAGQDSIIGAAGNSSGQAQWFLGIRATGLYSIINSVDMGSTVPAVGTPLLHTTHIDRTGAGTFSARTYINGSLASTGSGTYPFLNPTIAPAMGYFGGFGAAFNGTIHRNQLIKVPQGFDVAGWISDEIAMNASRWV